MPFFNNIHYTERGDPKNPVLIFLHGFLGSQKDWIEVTKILSTFYFCISPDLPGHGNSSFEINSFPKFNVWLDGLIKYLGSASVNIAGYSMGGRIALNFFCSFPNKVEKLILESAHPGIEDDKKRQKRYMLDEKRAKLITENYDEFLRNWYDLPLFGELKKNPNFNIYIQNRKNNNPDFLSKSLLAFSAGLQPNFMNCLFKKSNSILLICGEKDKKYKQLYSEMTQQNKSLSLSVINCGHSVHFEKPEQFAEHIQRFLSL